MKKLFFASLLGLCGQAAFAFGGEELLQVDELEEPAVQSVPRVAAEVVCTTNARTGDERCCTKGKKKQCYTEVHITPAPDTGNQLVMPRYSATYTYPYRTDVYPYTYMPPLVPSYTPPVVVVPRSSRRVTPHYAPPPSMVPHVGQRSHQYDGRRHGTHIEVPRGTSPGFISRHAPHAPAPTHTAPTSPHQTWRR